VGEQKSRFGGKDQQWLCADCTVIGFAHTLALWTLRFDYGGVSVEGQLVIIAQQEQLPVQLILNAGQGLELLLFGLYQGL